MNACKAHRRLPGHTYFPGYIYAYARSDVTGTGKWGLAPVERPGISNLLGPTSGKALDFHRDRN